MERKGGGKCEGKDRKGRGVCEKGSKSFQGRGRAFCGGFPTRSGDLTFDAAVQAEISMDSPVPVPPHDDLPSDYVDCHCHLDSIFDKAGLGRPAGGSRHAWDADAVQLNISVRPILATDAKR